MQPVLGIRVSSVVVVPVLLACATESSEPPLHPQLHSFAHADWSEPVNLGAPINSPAAEMGAELAPDELSLYVASRRTDLPGAVGALDIWVSRRACLDCPWETPVNLGPIINTGFQEGSPELSSDGHLLFFSSNRVGIDDIFVSRRADPRDDFGWGAPVMLGPDVNTEAGEVTPHYQQNAEDGPANLYFTRGLGTGVGGFDIYHAPVTRGGETAGPAALVAELNSAGFPDAGATIRADGREVFFWSTRPGGLGLSDIWVATRPSVHDSWSTPEPVGAPVNSPFPDLSPSLSHNGRTLLFVAGGGRGGLGLQDIWMATRTPSGR